MPGLHRIQVVDRVKMVDNTNVIKIEKSWKCRGVKCFGLYQVDRHFFLKLSCHCCVQQLFNPVNVLISNFFHWTYRLTDGQNRFLSPFAHPRAG